MYLDAFVAGQQTPQKPANLDSIREDTDTGAIVGPEAQDFLVCEDGDVDSDDQSSGSFRIGISISSSSKSSLSTLSTEPGLLTSKNAVPSPRLERETSSRTARLRAS